MTPHAIPDWVTPGATAVEVNRAHAVWTTVARITPTGMIRLASGATYKLASHGLALHKTGEQGPWIGHRRPTELLSGAEYLRRKSAAIVAQAAQSIGQLAVSGGPDPTATLIRMRAIVDAARERIAEAERKAANAGHTKDPDAAS